MTTLYCEEIIEVTVSNEMGRRQESSSKQTYRNGVRLRHGIPLLVHPSHVREKLLRLDGSFLSAGLCPRMNHCETGRGDNKVSILFKQILSLSTHNNHTACLPVLKVYLSGLMSRLPLR